MLKNVAIGSGVIVSIVTGIFAAFAKTATEFVISGVIPSAVEYY